MKVALPFFLNTVPLPRCSAIEDTVCIDTGSNNIKSQHRMRIDP